ncbi:SPFH domain-containing protein [Halomonas sp. V046]|uniref:SPFH domain-containing protein n=1 Tax=Halomonas sp. V046 TaxID=3459611 RepID=UPI0040440B8D
MNLTWVVPVVMAVGVVFLVIVCLILLIKAFYRKIDQGQALIVNDLSSTPKVYFTGAMVLPVIHRSETMKISVITLEINRQGNEGLICKDNLRADISVAFYLRVNETAGDVLRVAKSVGVGRASDRDAVNELFNAKFSEALKTVGKKLNFMQLFEERQHFRDMIIQTIGEDLNGYILEDVAIDYLEQTPKSALDPNNILDSEGIRRITEITATHNVDTNRLERDQELEIKRKNVAAREASLELDRSQADAEARQTREIETIRAREVAETEQVKEQERAKSEAARIKTDEELAVASENMRRQVEMAEKARERAVQIEEVRIRQARELEDVNRQRSVETERIGMEKALEAERKEIAVITSERISVERNVAQEEEHINDVRNRAAAERLKVSCVTAAEAEADEIKIKELRLAEAVFERSKLEADEVLVRAQAESDAAERRAQADEKQARGRQALAAADGLAEAQVQESRAKALRAEGLVEAEVISVRAKADEEAGLAEVRVLEQRLDVEASGEEKMGQAKASAREALARAEANGLIEKLKAYDVMSGDAREFEQFRMNLELLEKETLAGIEMQRVSVQENGRVMAEALKGAKFELIGGDGGIFDTFAKGLGIGKGVQGVMEKAPALQAIMAGLASNTLGAASPAKASRSHDVN